METIDYIYGTPVAILVVMCLSSCKKNRKRDDAVKIVTEWPSREIKFSERIFVLLWI
jgi:hypothetical protein